MKIIKYYFALFLFLTTFTVLAAPPTPLSKVPPFYAEIQTKIHLNELRIYHNWKEQKHVRKITEYVGWGAFQFNATPKELIAVFGQPDTNTPPSILRWNKYHIQCELDEEGLVKILWFYKGFPYPFHSDVGIGTPRIKAFSCYGIPERDVRSTNQTDILYYTNRRITLSTYKGFVDQIIIYREPNPLAIKSQPIILKEGWAAFRMNAKQPELTAALGNPDPGSTASALYWKRYHIYCLINPRVGAYALCFDDGFTDPLTSGIGIGSSVFKLLATYGQPDAVTKLGKINKYIYSKEQLMFSIESNCISRIVIFPDRSLSQMHSPLIEGSGWGAFRLGSSYEEMLTILGPPDNSPKPNYVCWNKYTISCEMDPSTQTAKRLYFGPKFPFTFPSGVGIGSPVEYVCQKYGLPINHDATKSVIVYPTNGITFHVHSNIVDEIVIRQKATKKT